LEGLFTNRFYFGSPLSQAEIKLVGAQLKIALVVRTFHRDRNAARGGGTESYFRVMDVIVFLPYMISPVVVSWGVVGRISFLQRGGFVMNPFHY
jgi:hypothetical protein